MTSQTSMGIEDAESTDGATLVDAMFRGAKAASAFGLEHDVTLTAARQLHTALRTIGCPLAIQFVADAAYCDRQLISVPAHEYGKINTLIRIFGNLGAHELSVHKLPTVDQVLRLCSVLAEGLLAETNAAEDAALPGIDWRVLPNAGFGGGSESVDPELFSVTQLSLAIADAERAEATLVDAGTWRWSAGLSAVRRIERGLANERDAMLRALELSPGPWSPARRAVSVARCIQQAMDTLRSPSALIRASGHAGLAVAIVGFVRTISIEAAAEQLIPLLEGDGSETTPHRLRVATVVRSVGRSPCKDLAGIAQLLTTAYELERLRVVVQPGQVVPRIELLALGLDRLDPDWMKLIVNMEGLLPPGARVVLTDGRQGIVLGAGDALNPWRPLVLCGADVLIPDRPVRFA